ncbi:MAG: GNAT family N-acetyltransferase [Phycisphaerae bacterium]
MLVATQLRGRQLVGLPYSDYCKCLCGSQEEICDVVDVVQRSAAALKVSYWEVRDYVTGTPGKAVDAGYVHVLQLTGDPDHASRRFRKTRIRDPLNKARTLGRVTVERSTDAAAMNTYYGLHLKTRKRLGAISQSRAYFHHLHDRMVSRGDGLVVLAFDGRKAIAGAVVLFGKGTAVLRHSASLECSWKLYPNHLVIWECIRAACERDKQRFDFGRTGAQNVGLAAFKRGWGTDAMPLTYTRGGSLGKFRERAIVGLRTTLRHTLPRVPDRVAAGVGRMLYASLGV